MVNDVLLGLFFQIKSLFIANPPPSFPVITSLPAKTPEVFLLPETTDLSIPEKSKPKPKVKAVKSAQTSAINAQTVLQALNDYRSKNGIGKLSRDNKLQSYAQTRADYLKSLGKLDKHAGHKEFMKNNGFNILGFNAIAENQSWNYKGSVEGLIESLYGKSSGHNKNQLNPEYTHVGIGINGAFTNLVFGGRKIY